MCGRRVRNQHDFSSSNLYVNEVKLGHRRRTGFVYFWTEIHGNLRQLELYMYQKEGTLNPPQHYQTPIVVWSVTMDTRRLCIPECTRLCVLSSSDNINHIWLGHWNIHVHPSPISWTAKNLSLSASTQMYVYGVWWYYRNMYIHTQTGSER